MAGGNFALIAKNVAILYMAFDSHPTSKNWDEDKKLFAAALLDLDSYIHKGAISLSDVARAVLFSKSGSIALPPMYIRSHGLLDYYKHYSVVNLAMQVEAIIIDADFGYDPYEIMDMVVSEKSTIKNTVINTMENGADGRTVFMWSATVDAYLKSPRFVEIIEAFSLDSSPESYEKLTVNYLHCLDTVSKNTPQKEIKEPTEKVLRSRRRIMKVLIWFLCLLAYAVITTLIGASGVSLGAIPTAILFAGAIWAAKSICKKWD